MKELSKMYDFETLMEEVLCGRKELNKEKLMRLIAEKKKNVGSGYLTDQGALFLIAGEYGVELKHLASTDLTIKDIYMGANDISIVARVLAIYPIMEYRRKDGTKGSYRRLVLFDSSNSVRLTVWDDNGSIQLNGVTVDTPIRVLNGYVRQGLDGKPNLNLGKRGRIEVISDESLIAKLSSLASITKQLDELETESNVTVVEGTAASRSRASDFTREDGSKGHMMHFDLSNSSGSRKIRVVIWNGENLPEVNQGTRLMVTNLRPRKTVQGETELHGDAGTALQFAELQPMSSSATVKVSEVKNSSRELSVEVVALSKGSIHDVTLKDGEVVKKGELVVGDDTGEITVVGWREQSGQLEVDVGEKLILTNVTHQTTKMGTEVLQLGGRSKVERVPRR